MTERTVSFVAAVGAAVAASLGAAFVDAHWSWIASGGAAGSRVALLGATLGLMATVGVAVGLGLAAVARIFWPGGVPELTTVRSVLGRGEGASATRLRLAIQVAVALAGSTLGLVAVAVAARRLFASGEPSRPSGALVALVAVGVALAVASLVVVAGRAAAARPPSESPGASPRVVVAAGAAFALLVLVWGVTSGSTGGDGLPFGILGVLKREELDLRAVFLVSIIAVAALAAPVLLARVASESALRLSFAVSIGLIVLSVGLAVRAAGRGLDTPSVALAIERGAPLASKALAVGRKLTDGDRDGVSRLFGGGDCNDRDARIFPGADDAPGNGIDEDCSGADDAPVAIPAGSGAAGTGAPVAGDPSGVARLLSTLPKDLSVILVTIDTLRAEMGFTGYPRPITANLDRLAARSVVFESAYSLASYTGKSLGPMLLGKHGSEASRTFNHFDKFGTDETFIQERLARAGFRTFTAQGHKYFDAASGLARGFEELDRTAVPRVQLMEGDQTVNSDKLTDASIRMLSKPEHVSGRFFLWVHYLDPHADYVPHAGFDFGNRGRDRYDGEVANTDRHIGRLLDFVQSSAFAPRTAIVVTSDHGEAFGEHGMYRHGFELWEELVRVPLIVHVPGVAPRRIKSPRSIVDITPTLVEVTGAPPPTGQGLDFFSGRSLLADMVLPPGTEPEPRPILVDMAEGPYNAERQAFIHDGMKLITTSNRPIGLYDLQDDPGEKKDLLADVARTEAAVAAFKAFRRTLKVVPARK